MTQPPKTRITVRDVDAAIAETHYFTAADGVRGQAVADGVDSVESPSLARTTFCVLVLRNGHRVTGVNYGPVDAESFDDGMACDLAHKDAIDKVWEVLGYELRLRMHGGLLT